MRNLEAVPSSHAIAAGGKLSSNSVVPGVDPSTMRRKLESSNWTTCDSPTSNQGLRPEDWRSHSMQWVGAVDSSSESSSLFSCCSDEGSCSTESTNDSSSTGDFSEYLFGEVGSCWYRNYGLSSDTDVSSSLNSRRSGSSSSSSSSSSQSSGGGRRVPHRVSSWGGNLEGEGNSSFLYNGPSNYSKISCTTTTTSTTQFGGSSSETDFGRLVAGNSGVPFKRAGGRERERERERERSAQTFY